MSYLGLLPNDVGNILKNHVSIPCIMLTWSVPGSLIAHEPEFIIVPSFLISKENMEDLLIDCCPRKLVNDLEKYKIECDNGKVPEGYRIERILTYY